MDPYPGNSINFQNKILQIVQAEHTTAAQSTSGTYADTGLTASITTSSSGHAGVFVIANLAMGAQAANGGDAYVIFNIVRDSTQVKQGMVGKFEDKIGSFMSNVFGSYSAGSGVEGVNYKVKKYKDGKRVN